MLLFSAKYNHPNKPWTFALTLHLHERINSPVRSYIFTHMAVASQMIPTAGWWALLSNLFSLLYHKTCICSGILVRESVSCLYLEWRSHETFPEGFVHVQNDNQWISLHLIINPTNWSCQCFQENFFVCLHMMYVLEYFLTGIASCCPDVSVW